MPNDQAVHWRAGKLRILPPLAVHAVALAGCVVVLPAQPSAWLWLCVVLASGAWDIVRLRRDTGCAHAAILSDDGVCIDGCDAHPVSAWLGPGWTVVWARTARGERLRMCVFSDEVTRADHATLRRYLRDCEFRR